jgi:hypothetical protein
VTDVLIGLPTVCLVALVLGSGWAAVFQRAVPYGALGFIFLAWTCAIASTSFVWAWVYPLDQGVRTGIWALLAFSAVGYLIALWRSSFRRLNLRDNIRPLVGIVAAVAVTLVAILPAVADLQHLSVAQRLGPDEVGYAIAADAIGNGLTKNVVEGRLSSQLVGGTVQTALTPKTEQVDKIPSLTTQVENEFLTGADRWGFAGAVGSIVYLFGASHLWSALTLLTAFALLTACIGLWICIRVLSGSAWAATGATIILGLNSSVLNSWHEGGLAQIWVMPAVLLLVLPVVRLKEPDRIGFSAAAGIGIVGQLPAYNSEITAIAAVLGVAMLLSLAVVRRNWWRSWWPVIAGAAGGAALVFPSTAVFTTTFLRSLQENGTAGWPLPRWSSIAESFGMANTYGSPYPVLGQRGSGELVLDGVENALIGGLLIGLLYRIRLRMSAVLLTSVFVVVGAVYVQSRYLDPTSNYQYFKAIVAVAPAAALGFGIMLGEALTLRPRLPPTAARRARRRPITSLWIASIVVVVAVAVAGCSYVGTFRSQGSVVPYTYTDLAGSSRAQSVFKTYNVVTPRTLPAFAVGAEVEMNWIGRYAENPSTRLTGRLDNPVALMITESTCPRFACVRALHAGAVVLEEGGVALVRLSPTTKPLARMPESQWPEWVASRFSAVGGGQLVEMTPVRTDT